MQSSERWSKETRHHLSHPDHLKRSESSWTRHMWKSSNLCSVYHLELLMQWFLHRRWRGRLHTGKQSQEELRMIRYCLPCQVYCVMVVCVFVLRVQHKLTVIFLSKHACCDYMEMHHKVPFIGYLFVVLWRMKRDTEREKSNLITCLPERQKK